MSEKWIRASEISSYLYCRRAWWLQHVEGKRSSNVKALRRGRKHHAKHAKQLLNVDRSQRAAYGLWALAALALLLWIVQLL